MSPIRPGLEPHMTRLRFVCAAGPLLLVLNGTTAAVLSALSLDLPALGAQTGATTFEVRLAELQPGARSPKRSSRDPTSAGRSPFFSKER